MVVSLFPMFQVSFFYPKKVLGELNISLFPLQHLNLGDKHKVKLKQETRSDILSTKCV